MRQANGKDSKAATGGTAKPGTLFVVATPIGNLEDITLRALRILREVDLIAAEDTRHTRKLLSHFDIHTPLMSYYKEKEASRAQEIVARSRTVYLELEAGEVALLHNWLLHTSDVNRTPQSRRAFSVVNATISYGWGPWSVTVWGRNLFDEHYDKRVFFFGNEDPDYIPKRYEDRADPRQIGVTVAYRF